MALQAPSPSSDFKCKAKILSSRGAAGACPLFGPTWCACACARFWFWTSNSRPPVVPRKEMSCVSRETHLPSRAHLQGPCPQVVKGKVLCGPWFCDVTPPDLASEVLPPWVPASLVHPRPPPTPVFTKRLPHPIPSLGPEISHGASETPQRMLAQGLHTTRPARAPNFGGGPSAPLRSPPDQRRTRALEWSAKLAA